MNRPNKPVTLPEAIRISVERYKNEPASAMALTAYVAGVESVETKLKTQAEIHQYQILYQKQADERMAKAWQEYMNWFNKPWNKPEFQLILMLVVLIGITVVVGFKI